MRSRWKAQEETRARLLDDKVDMFSAALVIWSLFSAAPPMQHVRRADMNAVYFELRRVPPMTPNVPPALQQLLHAMLAWNPRLRATAREAANVSASFYRVDSGFYRVILRAAHPDTGELLVVKLLRHVRESVLLMDKQRGNALVA